jgi:hypothetical protein
MGARSWRNYAIQTLNEVAQGQADSAFLALKREKQADGSLKGLTKKTTFDLLGLDKQLAPKNNTRFREFVETYPGWSSRRTRATPPQKSDHGITSCEDLYFTRVIYDPAVGDPEAFAAAMKVQEEQEALTASELASAEGAVRRNAAGKLVDAKGKYLKASIVQAVSGCMSDAQRVALATLGKNDGKLKVSNGKVGKKVKA